MGSAGEITSAEGKRAVAVMDAKVYGWSGSAAAFVATWLVLKFPLQFLYLSEEQVIGGFFGAAVVGGIAGRLIAHWNWRDNNP